MTKQRVVVKTMDEILGIDLDPKCKECNSTNTKFLHKHDAYGNSYRFCKKCKALRLITKGRQGDAT